MENNEKIPVMDPSRIIYRDEECAVVNKLCGEAVEGAGKGMGDLSEILAAGLGRPSTAFFPTPVHRLDVPVTGCVLFALAPSSLSFLSGAFSESENINPLVEKHYWAITEIPPYNKRIPETGELTHWISTDMEITRQAPLI
jgi:23S rRNA-/tRNA-specific pseudouridylate synthase